MVQYQQRVGHRVDNLLCSESRGDLLQAITPHRSEHQYDEPQHGNVTEGVDINPIGGEVVDHPQIGYR